MNLTQLIAEVNKDIDDELSNAEITGWLNRAIDDLSPYANYQKSSTISLVADQKQYTLPSDLYKIVHLIDEDKMIEYHQIPVNDLRSYGYKQWGNNIIIQPTPKESKDLTLYYKARLPHLVNASDVPEIPEEYHDLLVLYAVAKAKYQDEEESMQNIAMQDYMMRKDQFIAHMQAGDIYTINEVYW
jgi:hypothetical protein